LIIIIADMKYLQLFCEIPTDEFLNDLLKCYNINGLMDNHEFNKGYLIEFNTVEKLIDLIPELILYYLPCKAKIYLNDINEKRSITILSQFLKLYDYKLMREEKIINKKKVIFYRVIKQDDNKFHIFRNSTNYEVDFK
jgi:hypothetical protein